jgi:hypothetical protein
MMLEQARQEYNQKRSVLDKEILSLCQVINNTLPQSWRPTSQEFDKMEKICTSADQFFDVMLETITDRGLAEVDSCSIKELEALATVNDRYTLLKASYQAIKSEYLGREKTAVRTTFPIRTQSQTHSVQQLSQLRSDRGTPHAKAVLIAGCDHLGGDKEELKNDSNFDLTPFYEELRKHKAGIFLPLGVMAAAEAAFRAGQEEREKQRQLLNEEAVATLAMHQSQLEMLQAAMERQKI